MSYARWIPAWLGRAYSKLYLAFKTEPFASKSAEDALECGNSLTRVILSRLRAANLVSVFHREGKKRTYRLLDPETWVVIYAAGAGNLRKAQGPYFNLVCIALRSLIEQYGEALTSVVLYGSVARRRAKATSDVDLLVVASSFSGSVASRIDELVELEKPHVRREIAWLAKRGIYTDVSYFPLRPEEALLVKPLYLDLVHDAVILYDASSFFEKLLEKLRRRLDELGAKRVFLSEDDWYWALKPRIEVGEAIEV